MGILYTTQPEDIEPVEYTHFDCWEDDTTMEDVIHAWEASLGVTLPVDSWDSVIVQLLRLGYDVYEGDEFIEVYYVQGEE
jgi:hypothetical protein